MRSTGKQQRSNSSNGKIGDGTKKERKVYRAKIETDWAAGCWRLETSVYAVMHSLQEREERLRQGSNATKQSTGDERSCRWCALRRVAPLIGVLEQGGYDVQGAEKPEKNRKCGY